MPTVAVIDTPKPIHQQIQYVKDPVELPAYTGGCRQVTARGMGRESPTLFLTNKETVSGREIIKRYTNRNVIEIRFERRAPNPILQQAHLNQEPVPIPWLNSKHLRFHFR